MTLTTALELSEILDIVLPDASALREEPIAEILRYADGSLSAIYFPACSLEHVTGEERSHWVKMEHGTPTAVYAAN